MVIRNSLALSVMKVIYFGMLMFSLISCSTYKIAERHLNRKMEKAQLEQTTFTNSESDTIEFWDSGDTSKPAMLLVHGFGATTKYQWFKQVKMLSRDYRVIAPNLNYFGNSVPAEPNYTVAGQVKLLETLLEHLDVDTMTIFGVSYGGLVSIEYAKLHPDRIEKMLLFDSPIKFADSSDIEAVKTYFNAPSVEELFVPSDPKGLNKLMYLATGKKSRIPGGFLKEFYAKSYAYNFEDKRKLIGGLLADMELYSNRDYTFEMPILLIWGSEDKVVSLETGRKLVDYLGENAELHIINGAAHMPNITHEKEFNAHVSEFLGNHAPK